MQANYLSALLLYNTVTCQFLGARKHSAVEQEKKSRHIGQKQLVLWQTKTFERNQHTKFSSMQEEQSVMLHNKPNLIHWTPFTSQFSQSNFTFHLTLVILVILKWTGVQFIDKKDNVTWKLDVHSWIQHFVRSYSDLFTQK